MDLQTFNAKRPHHFLWNASLTARGKMTISGTPNCLNCDFFVGYLKYIIYKCGRGRHEARGSWVGNPWLGRSIDLKNPKFRNIRNVRVIVHVRLPAVFLRNVQRV
jgi:hypothetical protein